MDDEFPILLQYFPESGVLVTVLISELILAEEVMVRDKDHLNHFVLPPFQRNRQQLTSWRGHDEQAHLAKLFVKMQEDQLQRERVRFHLDELPAVLLRQVWKKHLPIILCLETEAVTLNCQVFLANLNLHPRSHLDVTEFTLLHLDNCR